MKRKVKYSSFSWLLTAFLVVGAVAGSVYFRRESWVLPTLVAVLGMMVVSVLFYAPLAIEADDENITIVSVIKRHRIPMREVAKAGLFQPTTGAVRTCGSGGLMGYWGLFAKAISAATSPITGRPPIASSSSSGAERNTCSGVKIPAIWLHTSRAASRREPEWGAFC